MKVSITFKTPGAIDDAIGEIEDYDGETAEQAKLREFLGQWIEYGEYVYIDFDTKAGTAVVQKLK